VLCNWSCHNFVRNSSLGLPLIGVSTFLLADELGMQKGKSHENISVTEILESK
jgi:hypothetical protein